jgi:aryl-alcohol dehydrogenase-like predicted oxidoreductase
MATRESTAHYFNRIAFKNFTKNAIRQFGKTGWTVSQIGFGGYRVHHTSEQHIAALKRALLGGVNLIDTSSKAGYVQGQNLKLVQEREAKGEPFQDVVKYMDGCWHCIHPDFLENQLRLSLGRLRLDSLDVYLLHNPEYFLHDARKKGYLDLDSARNEYYRRIKSAFEWLEEKTAQGTIRAYGVSSNTFPNASDEFESTSLERLLEIAEEVSANHHFQVIQFPFNVYETGACLTRNQANDSKTLLDLARERRLATLVNRPLNAMTDAGMIRLASFRKTESEVIEREFNTRLQKLKELEALLTAEILDSLPPEISKENVQNIFVVSAQMASARERFKGWSHWDHVKSNMLLPQISSYLFYLNDKLKDDPRLSIWAKEYLQTLNQLCEAITLHYENEAEKMSGNIIGQLDRMPADLHHSNTLSQKALRLLGSVDGIDCVLLGMRKVKYVYDALATMSESQVQNAGDILTSLKLDER